MKRNVSAPKIFLKELLPLSDQLESWLPGTRYQGLFRLSRICLASASSSSDPNSVMSPLITTKRREVSLLMSLTVLRRSSAAVSLPICVSDTKANRKDCALVYRQMVQP